MNLKEIIEIICEIVTILVSIVTLFSFNPFKKILMSGKCREDF